MWDQPLGAWSPHSGGLADTPERCTVGRHVHPSEMQRGWASLGEVPAVSPNPSIARVPLHPPQGNRGREPALSPSHADRRSLHLGRPGLTSLDQRDVPATADVSDKQHGPQDAG